jgi:hypothetical protein
MSIHTVWQSLDAKLQEKFHGQFGQFAFREAVTMAGMFYAHKYIKLNVHPSNHDALDRAWYGSLSANHPMHGLRTSVQDKIGDLAQALDGHLGSPIQKKFAVFDSYLVPAAEKHIDAYLERHFP